MKPLHHGDCPGRWRLRRWGGVALWSCFSCGACHPDRPDVRAEIRNERWIEMKMHRLAREGERALPPPASGAEEADRPPQETEGEGAGGGCNAIARTRMIQMKRPQTDELVGELFSTPKELRHLAEQWFGELFVPTQVLCGGAHATTIALRPAGQSPLRVHAVRERHWYPFRITRVEALGG